jgi:hypothetical protein
MSVGMNRRWVWFECAAWLAAAIAGFHFLAVWTKPGRCNSRGGSFNYATWRCGYIDNHPYLDIAAYMLPAFWLFLGCLTMALSVRLLRRRRPLLRS